MKAFIEHESRGRLRVRMKQYRMTLEQADLLEAYLQNQPGVLSATVHERTCCAVIRYIGDRENIIRAIAQFNYTAPSVTALTPTHSGRALNREYQEKLVGKVITKFACTLFLPAPLQIARTIWLSLPFLGRGLKRLMHRELKVELLDALSIGVSMVRRDFSTAGSVMFLLDIGELLEEWTHKKSVDDLARCMSLNVKRVWLKTDDAEVLVPLSNIAVGDRILVRMGNVIPLDGEVVEGEVMVNQASLTGESMPVAKRPGTQVYAGTVIEEGDCVIEVTQSSGESRYDKIVSMIEQSEQLKSAAESHAANLADKLVPYTLIGSAHFIFEDEKCTVPAGEQEKYDALPVEFSHLYLAIGGELAAVICIADPLRPEACDVMKALRALGIQRTVMLTGDSERTAAAIAAEVGVDDYRAEVLPEDKANFVEQERAAGHTVIMLGDGINDSPALSAANVGVAISDGAAIAREIADITIAAENLFELVALRRIARGLMSRINSNYRFVIGFNGSLIGLGVAGVLAPATSAMMHNLSTLGISLRSMTNLIDSSETTRLLESK